MKHLFLLLPGFGCDGDSMKELRESLEHRHGEGCCRAVDYDGLESLAEMTEHVRSLVGPAPIILVGFSMGGWLAQVAAAGEQDSIIGVILVSSWTHAPPEYLDIVRQVHDRIASGEPFSNLRESVAMGFAEESRREELADRWLEMVQRVGPDTFINQTRAILADPHVDEHARRLAVPVLSLIGDQDQLIPPRYQREATECMADCTATVIKNCGHNLPWEQPGPCNAAVEKWLSGLSD